MVDKDDIAAGPFEISFTTAPKSAGEDGKISWGSGDDNLSGMSVLLDDGTLLIRVTPGALNLLEEGGKFNTEIPDEAESLRLVCVDDPSFGDEE